MFGKLRRQCLRMALKTRNYRRCRLVGARTTAWGNQITYVPREWDVLEVGEDDDGGGDTRVVPWTGDSLAKEVEEVYSGCAGSYHDRCGEEDGFQGESGRGGHAEVSDGKTEERKTEGEKERKGKRKERGVRDESEELPR